MNILLTGASGFVGQNLTSYLAKKGIEVSHLSLRGDDEKHIPDNINAIIHLAGKAHDTKNASLAQGYFEVNTELTKKLFDKFIQSGARDFVYFSSVKAVADKVDGILEEKVDANPQTPYGESKWLAEKYLNSITLPPGKRLFILRPCMIHGPGNKGNLNLLFKIVDKGIPWPLAGFQNNRSFLSVENLCYVVEALITKTKIKSGTYNCADDQAISTNELIEIISETLIRKTKLLNISQDFIKKVAKIGDKVPILLNSERLTKLTESYVVSNQKIKNALEIDRLPLSVKEGVVKTIKSFKAKTHS